MAWLLTGFKAVGGFLWAYRVLIAVIGLAAVLGSVTLYVRAYERNKAKVIVLEDRLGRMEQIARSNQTAVEQCLAANEHNAREALLQADRARDAELRLAAAEANANRDVEEIDREAIAFRSRDLDCPALDADFRRWVLEP